MSINLGLYDLFANTVPGMLYIFVFAQILDVLGIYHFDLTLIDTSAKVLAIALISFVFGHIFNAFTYRGWYKLLLRQYHAEDVALKQLTSGRTGQLYSGFSPGDAKIIFAVIQNRDLRLAERLEASRANSIMMRNISFATFLLSVDQIIRLIRFGFEWRFVIFTLAYILFSWMALKRGANYERWFFRDVFRTAVGYGDSLSAIIKKSRTKSNTKVKQ